MKPSVLPEHLFFGNDRVCVIVLLSGREKGKDILELVRVIGEDIKNILSTTDRCLIPGHVDVDVMNDVLFVSHSVGRLTINT